MLPILPTAPSRTDPANFSAEADAWVAALPAWTDAVNAIEGSLQASTLIGTSTTSLSVGTGSKGFTSQAGKAWLVGAYLFIVATSDNTKVMQGKVTSYNSSTGSLVVDVNIASGSGTYSSWDIGVANPAIGYNNSATIAGTVTSQHPTDPACITNVNGTNALYMHSTSGASEINELRALPLLFAVNGAERMRIDASGNVGVGVTPSAWTTDNKSVDIGLGCSLSYSSGGVSLFASNTYIDVSSNYTRKLTGYGVMYQQTISDGSHVFYTATTGSAGSIISSWLPVLKLDASGNVLSVGNGGIGYGAGSGGSVTQTTSKSTLVTLNKISGQITMNAEALDANTPVFFLVTNSAITATDNVVVNLKGGYATYGTYDVKAEGIAAGSFVITLRNISAGSLSEAVVLSFAIIRGSTT